MPSNHYRQEHELPQTLRAGENEAVQDFHGKNMQRDGLDRKGKKNNIEVHVFLKQFR